MRIVAGKRKGLVIKTISENSTRPTKDMVREALFSILTNDIQDSRFLDLFAGSGAIGIEALSRGASASLFVDLNPKCVKVIKENIEKANFIESAEVYTADYQVALRKLRDKESRFDIIYIDPPYHKGYGTKAIELISEYDILADDGIIIFESDTDEEVPEEIGVFYRYNYKRYGRNRLNLFRRKG